MKPGKGEWVSPTGETHVDRMIPVLVRCSKEDIYKIAEFTGKHYKQEAIFFYLVSTQSVVLDTSNLWPNE